MEATPRPWWRRPVALFVRHYLEMVAAMVLGMVVLYPLWTLATDGVAADWVRRPDVEATVMSTAMALPMIALMIYRGHGARPIVEMTVAMFAGFWVLFPLLWWSSVDEMTVMMVGHVLMLLFMLVAMLLRTDEYTHAHTS
ncbi:hypothetical protein FE697_020735 [Mumia zhuanghuii]|uniref:Flagellar biosynthetic protein FliP n=1 Tax=Mumia zhuanghuii TaxID=2585211 RepID=A0A5Q6RK09_9ACTN|nr:hypothetical protein FE697_020735 [Mumia zhuanghuii]